MCLHIIAPDKALENAVARTPTPNRSFFLYSSNCVLTFFSFEAILHGWKSTWKTAKNDLPHRLFSLPPSSLTERIGLDFYSGLPTNKQRRLPWTLSSFFHPLFRMQSAAARGLPQFLERKSKCHSCIYIDRIKRDTKPWVDSCHIRPGKYPFFQADAVTLLLLIARRQVVVCMWHCYWILLTPFFVLSKLAPAQINDRLACTVV